MNGDKISKQYPVRFRVEGKLDPSLPLKYGENPGQWAGMFGGNVTLIYSDGKEETYTSDQGGFSTWRKEWEGKIPEGQSQLGRNNVKEIRAVRRLLDGFDYEGCRPTTLMAKHGSVCCFSYGGSPAESYKNCEDGNPFAIFGGVIGTNYEIDMEVANHIFNQGPLGYRELLGSTKGYVPSALDRILERQLKKIKPFTFARHNTMPYDLGWEDGIWMMEEPTDLAAELDRSKFKYPTGKPDSDVLKSLCFIRKVGIRTPSNGIVIGSGEVERGEVVRFQTYGIGTSVSRVGAAKEAVDVAYDLEMMTHPLIHVSGKRRYTENAVAASDGFFPFPDAALMIAKGQSVSHLFYELKRIAKAYLDWEPPKVKKDLLNFFNQENNRVAVLQGYMEKLEESNVAAVIQPGRDWSNLKNKEKDIETAKIAKEHDMDMVFSFSRDFFHP